MAKVPAKLALARLSVKNTVTLYRFELSFCGEPQGVGFLQGLTDVGLPKENDLYTLFDGLASPDLDMCDAVSFWFTEAGLQKFQDSINAVIRALEERDWQMLVASAEFDPMDAVYEDEDQMAFPAEMVCEFQAINIIRYTEISDVQTLLKSDRT